MTGAELKAIRKGIGLSLSQVTAQIEVSVATWCRWEADGEKEIPAPELKLFRIMNAEQIAKYEEKKRADPGIRVVGKAYLLGDTIISLNR